MTQDKAWPAENGQSFSKGHNTVLDHLGNSYSLWMTRKVLALGVTPHEKGPAIPSETCLARQPLPESLSPSI